MSVTLEVAAREAVTKVQPLLTELDEAADECHSALRYVGALREQLTKDRADLEQAVKALAATADGIQAQLAEDMTLATSALSLFVTAGRQAGDDGTADMDAEAAALEQAGELFAALGPRVDEVADAVEAARRAALEQVAAIGVALGAAVDRVEEVVGVELALHVSNLRQLMETAVGELIEVIGEKCSQFLDEKEADWREKLAAVRQLLERSIESVDTHTEEVAAYAGQKWERLADQETADLDAEVKTMTGELDALTQAVTNLEGQEKVAAETVGQRAQDCGEAATALESALESLRDRWDQFGIKC
jgi:chromosome segregation ATPase